MNSVATNWLTDQIQSNNDDGQKMTLPNKNLPYALYRGFKMLTCSWPGERVREGSLLIKLHDCPNSTLPPLIWCGTAAELEWVVAIMGDERSIFGIRGIFDFVMPTEKVIRDLGSYYVEEILGAIPSGPYVIAGYCSASFLSIEIATQLFNRGQVVGFLGLLERDLTSKKYLLQLIRRIFIRWDVKLTTWYDALNEFIKSPLHDHYIRVVSRVNLLINKPKAIELVNASNDSVARTMYGSIVYQQPDHEPLYEIKTYPGKIHLTYVRWGVFAYYQLDYFKQFWRQLAPKGVIFDYVPGLTHKYANWSLMIGNLKQRIKEAGY